MDDDEVAVSHDHPRLVFQRRRHALDEVEEALAAGSDVRAVLDVCRRPVALSRDVVSLVEQGIEGIKYECLIPLLFRLAHRFDPSSTSARAALAQSTSFCTAGAPLTPIAPTISPSTLMGKPPPYAATRASVGMPARSDGSPLIKSKKSCVETPNRAVYALFCAITMERIGAPSIRLKALRLPPSSRIATFSVTPSSLAFATASSTIFCASSEEMLCFFTTLAIGHLPPLDMRVDRVWVVIVGSLAHRADEA